MRVAYVVLALSLATTALVFYRVRINVDSREQARFDKAVRDQRLSIEQRIPRYVDEMPGVRGLFAAEGDVRPGQWRRFIRSLQIERSYPGTRALGYLQQVTDDERENFLKTIRGEPERGNFQIQPPGNRSVYFPEVYVSHFEPGSQEQTGLDHFTNPDLQSVMEQARDTGQAITTPKIHLSSGDALVVYLPVYRAGASANTIAERRAVLRGFVFAVLDPDRILTDILSSQTNSIIGCAVFDSSDMAADHLLHSSDRLLNAGENHLHQRVATFDIPVFNRTWRLYFHSLPLFETDSERNLPTIALVCWLTLSFLLFGLTAAEVKSRANSERITADLRKSEAALAAEKERLTVTLHSIGDGVITTDTKGSIVLINKAAEQMTGWTQRETAGKLLPTCFKIIHATTRQSCANPVDVVLRVATVFNRDHNVVLFARDGTERVIADSAAPIRARDGSVLGTVLVFRDVTDKQKSEAELLKESKLESVGLLAGGIAHDFNNILQGIFGNVSLARMNSHSTEKMLERLAGVEKSALRAKDLTQQLVMFARGGAPIRKQVQITGLVKDATLFALHGSNVTCEFSLPAETWPVDVDEGQFRQVINNITLNAVQAMPEGGTIEVRAENVEVTAGQLPPPAQGRHVKVSIRDHGTGIRPEHLSRIFDPYFTTRKHARGLGLASAYSVVRKHDGQIKVETQLARGTTFQIYLPASPVKAEPPAEAGGQKQFFGRGRILIMDDEAEILMLAGEMLKIMGFEVETARDGAEALEHYALAKSNGSPFSAVIMDLTIPEGMGGKEAIRRLTALDPQVKAIVSSGYSYDPVMASFQEYGFSGVIPKPYVMDDLARVLEEVLGKKAVAYAVAN